MIFYSWVALSGSHQTAASESDPTAPGENGLMTPGENGLMTPGESELMALSGDHSGTAGSPVAMGITDDRGRAMKAGEETLGSGRAALVLIEAVRPGMAARTLAPSYVRTGVAWLGRRTPLGEVAWTRFFLPTDPADQQAPGRIGS